MPASRAHLHLSKLDAFAEFLTLRGWTRGGTKGYYEVLRMFHPGRKKPLILYARNATEHATVGFDDMPLVKAFLREKWRAA